MDEGAQVAWPERFHKDELSAVQHAVSRKLRNEATFWAEYQNEPLADVGGKVGRPRMPWHSPGVAAVR